ncbi:MAG: hypothetical protein V4644_00265 [Patescibacteria group bacterium]
MEPQPVPALDPTLFMRGIDTEAVIAIAFLVFFFVWSIYTLIAAYHWLRYGHNSAVAIPALVVHVVVSWLLAGYAVSGLL